MSDLLSSETTTRALFGVVGAIGGFALKVAEGWWKRRDRYFVSVTRRTWDGPHGDREYPVVAIHSTHDLPISVTAIRIRNGFGIRTDKWPFDGEDPEYAPEMPQRIKPMDQLEFALDEDTLQAVADRFCLPFLSRVYVGVKTLGRREVIVSAERGLRFDKRMNRFRY